MSHGNSLAARGNVSTAPAEDTARNEEDFELDPLDHMLLLMGQNPDEIGTVMTESKKQLSEQMVANISKEPDMYGWLKVPTKHSHLRRLLRVKLIELFSERGMYTKFDRVVTNFEANMMHHTEGIGTEVTNNKVTEAFFGHPLPPEETDNTNSQYKLPPKVKRFGVSNSQLEATIMVSSL